MDRISDYKHECLADVFEFETRPKYTGFESIQNWDSLMRNYLKTITGQYDAKFYTPISHFIPT